MATLLATLISPCTGPPPGDYVGAMPIEIAPALEPQEWKERRCGALSLDYVDGEMHLVVTDPDGEIVSVSGPAELFALMALVNEALPDGDPRKITREQIDSLRLCAEDADALVSTTRSPDAQRDYRRDARRTRHVADVLERLLPPP